jgi:transketolase
MGLEDVGVMSALPNLAILSPCDAQEVRALLPQAARLKTPAYVRLSRAGEPVCHGERAPAVKLGRPAVLTEGTDAVVISYGVMVHEVLRAVGEVERAQGCSIRVVSWHTLKPLQERSILPLFKDGIPVVVVEEQMPGGSLGSRLALFLQERGISCPFLHLPLPERYPDVCGDRGYLLDRSKLSQRHLQRAITRVLGSRRGGANP